MAVKLIDVLLEVFSELKQNHNFCLQLCKDLTDRGLANLNIEMLDTLESNQQILLPHTTDMGKEFLKFITTPI
jgi:hypothetical protein